MSEVTLTELREKYGKVAIDGTRRRAIQLALDAIELHGDEHAETAISDLLANIELILRDNPALDRERIDRLAATHAAAESSYPLDEEVPA